MLDKGAPNPAIAVRKRMNKFKLVMKDASFDQKGSLLVTLKKSKEIDRKKRLEIEVFRKEEEVLQKIVESRQSYE